MSAIHWADRPFLCLDTETTGVDPFNDRIVETAAVRLYDDGDQTGDTLAHDIVNPGVPIPGAAAEVHGITTERAETEGVSPQVALEQLAKQIWQHHDEQDGQGPVVMFNARFDWPILLAEAARHRVEFPVMAPVLDPMLLDRMCDRYRKGGRRLELVADHYGVPIPEGEAHGARADALAAGLVMRRMLVRFPELREHTLASLWLHQAHGHEEWRQGFEDYLRRNKDPQAQIVPGWPVPVERGRT